MSDTKISLMPNAILALEDLIPILDVSATNTTLINKKTTVADILALAPPIPSTPSVQQINKLLVYEKMQSQVMSIVSGNTINWEAPVTNEFPSSTFDQTYFTAPRNGFYRVHANVGVFFNYLDTPEILYVSLHVGDEYRSLARQEIKPTYPAPGGAGTYIAGSTVIPLRKNQILYLHLSIGGIFNGSEMQSPRLTANAEQGLLSIEELPNIYTPPPAGSGGN